MTDEQKTLSRKFIAYKFLLNLWFIESIWLYFYRLFMDDAQIGIIDAATFAIGLIAEVPSGALADKFGKSRITKIGIVVAAIGIAGHAIGGYLPIFVAQALVMIGFALISGADEALFFQKLRFKQDSLHWRKLMNRAVQAAFAACIIAIPIGGFLYQFNHQTVFIINGLAVLASGLLIWNVRDNRGTYSKQKISIEIKSYLQSIGSGFKYFGHRNLRIYVPIILTLQGIIYIYSWGLLKLILMDRFHFPESVGGIMLGLSCAAVVIALFIMNKYAEHLHEKRVLSVLAASVMLGLLMSVPDIGAIGIVVILIFSISDGIIYPLLSEILNKHSSDSQRATVISVASFIKTLPYVALAPLIGWLNTHGQLHWFLIGWSVLIFVAWVYYFVNKKRDSVISVKVGS